MDQRRQKSPSRPSTLEGLAGSFRLPSIEQLEIQVALALPDIIRRYRRDPTAGKTFGDLAALAGNVAGVARGAVRAARAPLDVLGYVSDLAAPGDRYGARKATASALRDVGAYAVDRTLHPSHITPDIKATIKTADRALTSAATPQKPDFIPEMARRFDIGMNQGEAALDVGAFLVGGPYATSELFEPAADLAAPAKFLAQGYSEPAALHFSLPYERGMGSHYLPRRFAKFVPADYMDSPFNLMMPKLQSRGNFYEFHARVDDQFNVARTPNYVPELWTAKQSGVKRPPLAIRLWDGMPIPLKLRLGGLGSTAGDLGEVFLGDPQP